MKLEYTVSADEALERLKLGNERYLLAKASEGDLSPEKRLETCKEGQKPYAVIVACSDSRVMPESIFGFTRIKSRRYGAVGLTLYQRGEREVRE